MQTAPPCPDLGPLSPAASQDTEQVAARQALPDPPRLPAPDLRRPHLSWEVAAPGIRLPLWPRGKSVPTHLSNCQGHMCRLASPRVQSQPPDLLLPSLQGKPDTPNSAAFVSHSTGFRGSHRLPGGRTGFPGAGGCALERGRCRVWREQDPEPCT